MKKLKVPSHKTDVEEALLSTLMVHPHLLKILKIKPEHFYHHWHQGLFNLLVDMNAANEVINLVTFGSRLTDTVGYKPGELPKVCAMFIDEWRYDESNAETYLKILAEELAKRKIQEAYEDESLAPKEFIEIVKKTELEFIEDKPIALDEFFDGYEKRYNERKKRLEELGSTGIITGFKFIDSASLREGNFVVIAAKPNVGKTALSLNVAVNAAMFNSNVLFFSTEMSADELMDRIMGQLSGVAVTRFRHSDADNSINDMRLDIASIGDKFKIIEAGSYTSSDVLRVARQEAMQRKIDLVVVDYIQLLKDPIQRGETNTNRVGNISSNLKALAMELKCVVISPSQVVRNHPGIPELHHLRDSGNIEQDADIVFALHREEKSDTVADLVIRKNRNGEADIGTKIMYNLKLTKFYEK